MKPNLSAGSDVAGVFHNSTHRTGNRFRRSAKTLNGVKDECFSFLVRSSGAARWLNFMNDKRQAFPLRGDSFTGSHEGMTLHQFYAGMALMGQCANPDCEPEDVAHNAIVAFKNADAMMAVLAQREAKQSSDAVIERMTI